MKAVAGLKDYLLMHENDIALDLLDFGKLSAIFVESFGRKPENDKTVN